MNIEEQYYKQLDIIKLNIAEGKNEESIKDLLQMVQKYGEQKDILFELGKIYFLEKKFDDAEKIFEKVLKYKNMYSYIFISKILRYKNNIYSIKKAIKYLLHARRIFSNNIEIILELIECYLYTNNIKEIKKNIVSLNNNKVLKNDINVLFVLFNFYRRIKSINKLSNVLNKILLIQGSNFELELELVEACFEKKLYSRAEKKLKNLIKKYPKEKLEFKKRLQKIYRLTNDRKKLLKTNIELLNFNLSYDNYLLKETIELLCEKYKFCKAFSLVLDFEKKYNVELFDLEELIYNNILKRIYTNNLKKFSCELINKLLKIIPTEKLKLRNSLLNEKEIIQKELILKSKPRKIQLVLTNKCNLRCIMCNFHNYDWNFNDKQIKDLENTIPYLEYLIWQGGEVFLNKNFFYLFDLAIKNRVNQTIITNALLIDENILEKIIKNNVSLAISIDDITKEGYEKIRVGGDFDKLISKLNLINYFKEKYKNSKSKIHMSVVVMKSNYNKLEDILDFAIKYRFDSLELNPIQKMSEKDDEQIFFPNSDYKKIEYINNIIPKICKKAKKFNININIAIPTTQSEILKNKFMNKKINNENILLNKKNNLISQDLKQFKISKKIYNKNIFCLLPWQSLMISLDGYVSPSCICKLYNNDTIKYNSIDNIWNSQTMILYRKALIYKGMYKLICSEGCISNSIPKIMQNIHSVI